MGYIVETKVQWWWPGAGGEVWERYCIVGIEFQFRKRDRVLRMVGSDGCTTV